MTRRPANVSPVGVAIRARRSNCHRLNMMRELKVVGTFVLVPLFVFASSEMNAATLGRVTAVESAVNALFIDGEGYRLTAESRLFDAAAKGDQPLVITPSSIRVGDYVVFERDGVVIRTLKRMSSSQIDLPPLSPSPLPSPSPLDGSD